MNKERAAYYALTKIDLPQDICFGLCNFCKFAFFSGSCNEADLECEHPLEVISESDKSWEAWAGNDCWGFHPRYVLSDCVDAIGMYLQGIHPDWGTLRERTKIKAEKE